MESSTGDIEASKKLIQLVKEQPFLYDKNLEGYKYEPKKNEAWETIARSLNLEVDEVQIKWTRLRVEFGRHRRKLQEAEVTGIHVRDWPLYKLLSWLAPHVKTRGKRSKPKNETTINPKLYGYKTILPRPEWLVNVDNGVSVDVSPSIVMQNGHKDNAMESLIVSPDAAVYEDDASLDNAQKLSSNQDFESGKDHSYSSSSYAADSRISQPTGFEDEDDLFCRSICASLRRFTSQQKALAKIRIQQVMYEVEFNQPESLGRSEIESFAETHDISLPLYVEEMKVALGPSSNENFIYSVDADCFSWKKRISGGFIVRLGKVKLTNVSVAESYEEMLDKSLEMLSSLQEHVVRLEKENSCLRGDRDTALGKVTEIVREKTRWEKDLYGRFIAVLNAKKERIRVLQDTLDKGASEENDGAIDQGVEPDSPARLKEKADSDSDDPYGGDTDVDSDDGAAGGASGRVASSWRTSKPSLSSSSSSSAPPSAVRWHRDLFDLPDSPGSPSPVLIPPKRSRLLAKGKAPPSSTPTSTQGRDLFKDAIQVDDDDDDDMAPLTLDMEDDTQDLLDKI